MTHLRSSTSALRRCRNQSLALAVLVALAAAFVGAAPPADAGPSAPRRGLRPVPVLVVGGGHHYDHRVVRFGMYRSRGAPGVPLTWWVLTFGDGTRASGRGRP